MWLNFDSFCLVLDKLCFNQVIICRSVCKEWKNLTDRYLQTQKVLTIFSSDVIMLYNNNVLFNELFEIELSMNLNFRRKFEGILILPKNSIKNGKNGNFERDLVRIFPNVCTFCFFMNEAQINYEILLSTWTNISKLAIQTIPDDFSTFFKCLNNLNFLETFIVLNAFEFLFPPKEPFLKRLKRLYVPSMDYLINLSLPSQQDEQYQPKV